MIPLYLGIAALAWLFTGCNSEEKKQEQEPMITAEPPPRNELTVGENEPAYGVYLQLTEAGLPLEKMDRVKRDGKVTEEDLFYAGDNFYLPKLSQEENQRWLEKIHTSFKDASSRYFDRGAGQNGLTFPDVCKDLSLFKKALFWNNNNEQAEFYLGACQSDPKRLQHVLQLNPEHAEAKQALEKIYRESTMKNPKDAETWKNLGDVLKMQGKEKEANAAYHKALEINPQLQIARGK